MTGELVVLGAGGKLGRLLAPTWPQDVVEYTREDLDVQDSDRLTDALRGARGVLCLAGVTNGSDRPLSLNTELARVTLDAARNAKSGRVFLMSSAAVYGRLGQGLSETCDPTPVAAYGHAKAAMEAMAAKHPHPNTCLRLGNVAGADAILGNWRPGFSLDVLPNGATPARSYIGIQSLARVICELNAHAMLPSILNVAAPGTVRMGDLLDAAGLAWSPRTPGPDVITSVCLDIEQLCDIVEFTTDDCGAFSMVNQWREVTDAK